MIIIEKENKFLTGKTFIDLFCGIGAFHQALSSFGAKCVFSSDIDKHASCNYKENYGITPFGDISKIKENLIPKHNILCAGFPCQPFSISGKQKGFEDTKGTLFFEIARIANYHQPDILILENVKNIVSHQSGKTFSTIINTLNTIGYNTFYDVLESSDYGIPQNRKRVFIVAFNKKTTVSNFSFPEKTRTTNLNSILEDKVPEKLIIKRKDYILTDKEIKNFSNKPIKIGYYNKGGQGERIYHPNGQAITLSAQGGGLGAKTGLYKINNQIRRLTVRECARLQGFPENFIIHPNHNQAYKQFGNSITIDVIQHILFSVKKTQIYKK